MYKNSTNQLLKPVTAKVNDSGNLEIGGCDTVELVEKYGSPLYVMDEVTLRNVCRDYKDAFSKYPKVNMMFASKALSTMAISSILISEGFGFDVVSAGEILHYKLKFPNQEFSSLGKNYLQIGNKKHYAIFDNLDFKRVYSFNQASFLFVGEAENENDTIEKYLPILNQAASMGLPLLAVGNDTSTFMNEKIALSAGAIAEQYAVLGGKILTIGKPDPMVMTYCIEALPQDIAKEKILVIGDNIATDIKAANLLNMPSVLISKGVHINFLGEGYISDVAKTRELATSLDAYPDCVISNLRW